MFDDGMTRLYFGDANEVIPQLGEIFDGVVFDPPRLGSVTMSAIELARVLVPYTDGWIIHLAGGKQWDFWAMPNLPHRMPQPLLPNYNENEYVVFVHPSGFTQGAVQAPHLKDNLEPYTPPAWCRVARHPELYRWLYSFLMPQGDALLLDPCCGSGNSLLVAREMGIRSVGIEWNEETAHHIQDRLNECC